MRVHTPGKFASAPEKEKFHFNEVYFLRNVFITRELTSNAPADDASQKVMTVLSFHLEGKKSEKNPMKINQSFNEIENI